VLNGPRSSILQYVFRFSQLNILCSDCGCLRLRQHVGRTVLEEPAVFIFSVRVVYSEVGWGNSPEDVGRCVYVVAAAKLWVVVVVLIIIVYCTALHRINE